LIIDIADTEVNLNVYRIMAQSKNNEDLMERGESGGDEAFTPKMNLGSPTSTISALGLMKELHGGQNGQRRAL
jgi:hypothetical protein